MSASMFQELEGETSKLDEGNVIDYVHVHSVCTSPTHKIDRQTHKHRTVAVTKDTHLALQIKTIKMNSADS